MSALCPDVIRGSIIRVTSTFPATIYNTAAIDYLTIHSVHTIHPQGVIGVKVGNQELTLMEHEYEIVKEKK